MKRITIQKKTNFEVSTLKYQDTYFCHFAELSFSRIELKMRHGCNMQTFAIGLDVLCDCSRDKYRVSISATYHIVYCPQ